MTDPQKLIFLNIEKKVIFRYCVLYIAETKRQTTKGRRPRMCLPTVLIFSNPNDGILNIENVNY